MSKYEAREYRLGEYWLGQRPNSPAWYAIKYDAVKRQNVRSSLGTTDYEQAKEKLAELYLKHRKLVNVPLADIGLAEVLTRYWDNHAKNVAAAATIRGQIPYWLEFYGTDDVASACAYARLNEFKVWLQGKGLSASTINHTLMIGRAACRMAWKKGELQAVPAFEMMKVGNQRPMGRPLTIPEMVRCLNEAHEPHMFLLLLFLIGTAARPAAITEMDWKQIDHEAGLIHLNPIGREQNKKRRPTVRLPAALADLRGVGPLIMFRGKRPRSVMTSWRKLRDRAELGPDANLYSFRHTVGRWMRTNGVPVDQIKLQLGHGTVGVTERYIGFAPDYLAEAKQAIDKLFCQLLASDGAKSGAGEGNRTLDIQLGKLTFYL